MLTDSSLALITFINLFLIPFISLRIYCKRHTIEWKITFELAYRYALFCILNLPFTRIACSLLKKIFGTVYLADSSKYTLIAIITATLLPILVEIVEHYVKIDVDIDYKKNKKTKDKKEQK